MAIVSIIQSVIGIRDSSDSAINRKAGGVLFSWGERNWTEVGYFFSGQAICWYTYEWLDWCVKLQSSKMGSKGLVYTNHSDFDLWYTNIRSAIDLMEKQCEIWGLRDLEALV